MRTVMIETKEVGQSYGVCAVIRSASGRKIATTQTRPYGFEAAAISDAETLCERRGWKIETDGE